MGRHHVAPLAGTGTDDITLVAQAFVGADHVGAQLRQIAAANAAQHSKRRRTARPTDTVAQV